MPKFTSCLAWIGSLLLGAFGPGSASETVLPQGSAPAAIVDRHFPDRVHAFVWRNWNVVESSQLAKILGTSVDNVNSLAASMGLPPTLTIPPEMAGTEGRR